MRMNRFDWLAKVMPLIFSKPVKKRKPPKPPPEGPPWIIAGAGARPFFVNALTKSEARAKAKALLGISRKARLPVGTLVQPKRQKVA